MMRGRDGPEGTLLSVSCDRERHKTRTYTMHGTSRRPTCYPAQLSFLCIYRCCLDSCLLPVRASDRGRYARQLEAGTMTQAVRGGQIDERATTELPVSRIQAFCCWTLGNDPSYHLADNSSRNYNRRFLRRLPLPRYLFSPQLTPN
jgi:hypothetical protein